MLWAGRGSVSTTGLVDTLGAYGRAGLHHLVGIPWMQSGAQLATMDAHARLEAQLENLRWFASDVRPRVA
jgi:hypothetical protein